MIKTANEIPIACEKEIVTSTDDDLNNVSPSEIMTEDYAVRNTENVTTFEPSEHYNGACFDNYCWSQSINEIGK